MQTILTADRDAMGRLVAKHAADDLRNAIEEKGHANIVVATGSSQFEVLRELVRRDDVDWDRVTGFHLDEYIGISIDHPASFCGYLKTRLVDQVPLASFHFLDGQQDPQSTIKLIGSMLAEVDIDLALVGIGENGHLAFNDPPADFQTEEPYLIVELDEPCRMQQVGEGWFASLDDVLDHLRIMGGEGRVVAIGEQHLRQSLVALVDLRLLLERHVRRLFVRTLTETHLGVDQYSRQAPVGVHDHSSALGRARRAVRSDRRDARGPRLAG